MAVACASPCRVEQLIFLTDVEGVLGSSGQVRRLLDADAAGELIARGVVTGGMRAKLDAALAALRGGVLQVRIASGAGERVLERVLAGEPIGTQMTPARVAA